MDDIILGKLFDRYKNGEISKDDLIARLRTLPFENINGFANIDNHRNLRCGFPEVVYGQGKTPEQLILLANKLANNSKKVLITRLEPHIYLQVQSKIPSGNYNELARIWTFDQTEQLPRVSGITILTAGTIDIPVAEEARITAEFMDNDVFTLYDVGVAGLHRLLSHLEAIQNSHVLIVVAGMDGALPSVVGGLVSVPVIAVPTSQGYGASLGGIAALLSMLNSCASGVSVVNIDNGFGAGVIASRINHITRSIC